MVLPAVTGGWGGWITWSAFLRLFNSSDSSASLSHWEDIIDTNCLKLRFLHSSFLFHTLSTSWSYSKSLSWSSCVSPTFDSIWSITFSYSKLLSWSLPESPLSSLCSLCSTLSTCWSYSNLLSSSLYVSLTFDSQLSSLCSLRSSALLLEEVGARCPGLLTFLLIVASPSGFSNNWSSESFSISSSASILFTKLYSFSLSPL